MTGGLLQLISFGAQDVYLTKDPKITFFKVVYKRYVNFSMAVIDKGLSDVDFDKSITYKIPSDGDLLTKMYLKITITGTSSSTGKWAFVNNLANSLINNVSLIIGGSIIDTIYGEWLNIWNELFRNPEHDRGYNIMIGNTSTLTTLSNADKSTTLYIPFRFFFNKHNGLAFPLIALQQYNISVRITFNKQTECYYKQFKYLVGSTPTDFSVNLTLSDPKLLITYIYLDGKERNRYTQNQHEYLLDQHNQRVEEDITTSNKIYDLNLYLNHSVKALFWVLKNKNHSNNTRYLETDLTKATKRLVLAYADLTVNIPKGNYLTAVVNVSATLQNIIENSFTLVELTADQANATIDNIECEVLLTASQLSDINWETTLGSTATRNTGVTNDGHQVFDILLNQKTNFGKYIDNTVQTFDKATLKFNGTNRFNPQTSRYFNNVQAYEVAKCSPSVGIYMYSFALNLDKFQPSGACNFSKLDTATLNLEFTEDISNYSIVLYAINHNLLKIKEGLASLVSIN